MSLRHLFFLFILFSALSVQAVAQAAGQGAVDDLTARAGTPQDMARHYQQITHKLAAGDPKGAWALARQVLDFQHMPAEFLHLIAQVAEAAHSPELARPHQTDKTSIGLSAIMPPLYRTLRPHFTIERQISHSRHVPEDYRHWTISVAMVKKF